MSGGSDLEECRGGKRVYYDSLILKSVLGFLFHCRNGKRVATKDGE